MIEILENIHNHYGSVTGIIAPDGKAYKVVPYNHLEFMETLLTDPYEKQWIADFKEETERVVDEIYEEANQDGGGWHNADFYNSEQEDNLMDRLYGLGFFRFYAQSSYNIYLRGDENTPTYHLTFEGSKKNVGNITNLLADLRTKFEDKITINVETR